MRSVSHVPGEAAQGVGNLGLGELGVQLRVRAVAQERDALVLLDADEVVLLQPVVRPLGEHGLELGVVVVDVEQDDVRRQFDKLDTDGDGKVDLVDQHARTINSFDGQSKPKPLLLCGKDGSDETPTSDVNKEFHCARQTNSDGRSTVANCSESSQPRKAAYSRSIRALSRL